MSGKIDHQPSPHYRKMQTEARRFAAKRLRHEPTPERLRAMILALTGKLPPEQLRDLPAEAVQVIIRQFQRAVARERGKARSGHRSYDVNRHIALHQALRKLQIFALDINATRP